MCAGGDVDNAVESVEVGGESAVVGFRFEEEFGQALDCVGWVGGEEGGERAGYGGYEDEDLRGEGYGWDWWRGVFFVGGGGLGGRRYGGLLGGGDCCYLGGWGCLRWHRGRGEFFINDLVVLAGNLRGRESHTFSSRGINRERRLGHFSLIVVSSGSWRRKGSSGSY